MSYTESSNAWYEPRMKRYNIKKDDKRNDVSKYIGGGDGYRVVEMGKAIRVKEIIRKAIEINLEAKQDGNVDLDLDKRNRELINMEWE